MLTLDQLFFTINIITLAGWNMFHVKMDRDLIPVTFSLFFVLFRMLAGQIN